MTKKVRETKAALALRLAPEIRGRKVELDRLQRQFDRDVVRRAHEIVRDCSAITGRGLWGDRLGKTTIHKCGGKDVVSVEILESYNGCHIPSDRVVFPVEWLDGYSHRLKMREIHEQFEQAKADKESDKATKIAEQILDFLAEVQGQDARKTVRYLLNDGGIVLQSTMDLGQTYVPFCRLSAREVEFSQSTYGHLSSGTTTPCASWEQALEIFKGMVLISRSLTAALKE